MNPFEILIAAVSITALGLMLYHGVKDWHSIGEDLGFFRDRKDRLDA